jgi:hypothetical protein
MKKLLIVGVVSAVFLLSGCASRHVGPAIVGGAIGYAIGQNANQPRPMTQTTVVIVQEHSPCDKYTLYNERQACQRGINQRIAEENRRRENEAYKQGYGR